MRALLPAVLALAMSDAGAQAALPVLAAGSLRAPLTEAARAFEAQQPGVEVKLGFGASGLLRDRIVQGDAAQLFASANLEHPRALAETGRWLPVQAFARNALCVLAPRRLGVTQEKLVAWLLDPAIRVGTSTPKADPSGDYAFEMFARIAQLPGMPPDTRARLEAKALQLTGGAQSPQPPQGRSVYAMLVAQGQADLFVTYCTNAAVAVAEDPQLQSVTVPAAINVGADYGLTVRTDASPPAHGFAAFLLGPEGQRILSKYGFLPVAP